MTSSISKVPNDVSESPQETQAAPASDDRFTQRLRGFGPLGIDAILVLAGNMVVALPSVGRTSYHRPECFVGHPVSQNRRDELISSLKWDVLPGNVLNPAHEITRWLSFCTAFRRFAIRFGMGPTN